MIIPMKKATLIALKQDRDKLLIALQRCGEFMAIVPGAGGAPDAAAAEDNVRRIDTVLQFLARFEKNKKNPFAPRPSIAFDALTTQEGEGAQLMEEGERIAQALQAARGEEAAREQLAQTLLPWEALDIPLERIGSTAYTRSFAGFVPVKQLESLREALAEADAQLQTYGHSGEGIALFVLCHRQSERDVRDALKAAEFTEATFARLTGTAGEARQKLLQEAQQAREKAKELENRAAELNRRQVEIQTLFERRSAELQRNGQPALQSQSVFFMQGWVRADRQDEVRNAVGDAVELFDLSYEDPSEDELPPTVVQNGPLVTPFEAVTDLYSRPHPNGYDPNTIMAIFYFIFFGMMMSDAGYGIVTTVLLFLVQRIIKPRGTFGKLVGVLFFGSISTVIWGFCFGGIFGLSLPPLLFNPMDEPLKMLLLSYALGLVHLLTGISIKMVLLFKSGDWKAAVFDQLCWMLVIFGLLMLALPATAPVGKWLAIVSTVLIVLMKARDNKNIFGRLFSGVLSLYDITGYFSDVLSYSRVFALGLATGVVAMVVNTVAGMLTEGSGILGALGFVGAILVLAGGHVFNIAINMLGAFVHTARLQYIEFYGKFYEPGGYEFKPLTIRPKYLNITR